MKNALQYENQYFSTQLGPCRSIGALILVIKAMPGVENAALNETNNVAHASNIKLTQLRIRVR